MPSRAARSALAAAWLMLLAPSFAIPAPQPEARTRIGIFGDDLQDAPSVARALGVRYLRMPLAVIGYDSHELDRIRDAEAAGFRLNVQFNNFGTETAAGGRSAPVTDDGVYEKALGADLDATHPNLVTIQNDEDGPRFWNGGPQVYLHELTAAVRVAHARGYRIANGGLTSEGVKLAYWHYLWTGGQHAVADSFAQRSLEAGTPHRRVITDDLPSSRDPGRPILDRSPFLRGKLGRAETLIAGYRATGADYVNFHWYESDPDDLRAVATWLSQKTGLPAICNEMGQHSNDPDKVTALLAMSQSLHLSYVIWVSGDGKGSVVGLADSNGALRASGQAFRAFVASHR